MGAKTDFAQVPGGRLSYERAGRGSSLIWIHAAIADQRMWDREFVEYGREHEVVRYDVRGFGASTAATAPYSDSADLLALLDHLGIARASLVGASNGGRIAIDLALSHPERVDRLVLAAPGVGGLQLSGDPGEKAAFDEEDRRMGPIQAAFKAGDRKAALDGMRKFWCAAAEGPALDLVVQMLHDNLDEVFTDASARHATRLDPPAASRLGSITVPTLVLVGDQDAPGMRFIVDRVTAGIPGATRTVVPGADHLINLSRPREFDEAVREFLVRPDQR